MNYMKNLWNGNIKLVIVFWVYYIIIGSFLNELFFLVLDRYNGLIFILTVVILYVFSLFTNKFLWSTATKYKGNKIWTFGSKVIVLLDLFWLFFFYPLRLLGIEIF